MQQFHINPATGNPNLCRAKSGGCPFGSPEEHHATKEEARAAFEEAQAPVPKALAKTPPAAALFEAVAKNGFHGANFRALQAKGALSKLEHQTLTLYRTLGEELATGGPSEHTQGRIAGLHFSKESLSPKEQLMLEDMEELVKNPQKKVTVYHGSAERFESFSYAGIGKNGSSEGQGFYFTDSRKVAAHYGTAGYLYEVDFAGKKALALDKLTLTRQQFGELLEAVHEETDHLSDWGDVEDEGHAVVLKRALDGEFYTGPGANDVDNVSSLINSASGSAETVYRLLYDRYGYDHIPAKPDWGTKGQTVYVATVPEAFSIFAIREIAEEDFAEEGAPAPES